MSFDLKTPGVYVEEVASFPPSVAQVATAIPAFIGYTEKAADAAGNSLKLVPRRITSLLEYQAYFGKAQQEEKIVVKITDDTNGTNAVASLAAADASKYSLYYAMQLFFANGGGPCYIVSVGTYAALPGTMTKTDFHAGITAIEAYDEPTLIVIPEGVGLGTDYYEVAGKAIDLCAKLQDRFTIMDVICDATQDTDTNISNFRTNFAQTNDLNYAAAYYPYLISSINYDYDDTKTQVIVNGGAPVVLSDAGLQKNYYYAALSAIGRLTVTLSPSAAMAGVYAAVDSSRGVWKAPANVSLAFVTSTVDYITDEENGDMNIDATAGKSVNAIRAFTGKGILVWGARTLDGNSNDFRYVPVRRFFIMVEESVRLAVGQFVFEPNDANTWVKVRAMIENFLTNLWREGALAGAKAEQSFYVKTGLGVTMTSDDILNGRMIVEIGIAPVRPAEFIVLRFVQQMQQS
jgi:phage tail sheath protein FI